MSTLGSRTGVAFAEPATEARVRTREPLPQHLVLRGRYEILESIHVGRKSTVYEGFDTQTQRRVAIKEVDLSTQTDWKPNELLRREHDALGKFSNPGVPKPIEFFEDNGSVYLVQDFVEGTKLETEYLARHPFTEAEAVKIVKQLLTILQEAHEQDPKIVHRDISPKNVLVGSQGNVSLIDFGLASEGDARPEQGAGTTIFYGGTPGFIDRSTVTIPVPQTDIFGAGDLLLHLLTNGQHNADTVINEMTHQMVLPGSLSERMRIVIAKALDPIPANRYCSAKEMNDALTEPGEQTGQAIGSVRTSFFRGRGIFFWSAPIMTLVAAAAVCVSAYHVYNREGDQKVFGSQTTHSQVTRTVYTGLEDPRRLWISDINYNAGPFGQFMVVKADVNSDGVTAELRSVLKGPLSDPDNPFRNSFRELTTYIGYGRIKISIDPRTGKHEFAHSQLPDLVESRDLPRDLNKLPFQTNIQSVEDVLEHGIEYKGWNQVSKLGKDTILYRDLRLRFSDNRNRLDIIDDQSDVLIKAYDVTRNQVGFYGPANKLVISEPGSIIFFGLQNHMQTSFDLPSSTNRVLVYQNRLAIIDLEGTSIYDIDSKQELVRFDMSEAYVPSVPRIPWFYIGEDGNNYYLCKYDGTQIVAFKNAP